MSELAALYAYHRRLGYSRTTSLRLALWCLDPFLAVYPEQK